MATCGSKHPTRPELHCILPFEHVDDHQSGYGGLAESWADPQPEGTVPSTSSGKQQELLRMVRDAKPADHAATPEPPEVGLYSRHDDDVQFAGALDADLTKRDEVWNAACKAHDLVCPTCGSTRIPYDWVLKHCRCLECGTEGKGQTVEGGVTYQELEDWMGEDYDSVGPRRRELGRGKSRSKQETIRFIVETGFVRTGRKGSKNTVYIAIIVD